MVEIRRYLKPTQTIRVYDDGSMWCDIDRNDGKAFSYLMPLRYSKEVHKGLLTSNYAELLDEGYPK